MRFRRISSLLQIYSSQQIETVPPQQEHLKNKKKPIEYLKDLRHFLEIATGNNIHASFSISMFLAEPRMTVKLYKTVLHMI